MKLYFVILALLTAGCAGLPRSANYESNVADGANMAVGQSKAKGTYVPKHEFSYSSFSGDQHILAVEGTQPYLVQWYDQDGQYHQELVNEPYRYGYKITNSPTYGRGFTWGVVNDPKFVIPHSTVIAPGPNWLRRK